MQASSRKKESGIVQPELLVQCKAGEEIESRATEGTKRCCNRQKFSLKSWTVDDFCLYSARASQKSHGKWRHVVTTKLFMHVANTIYSMQ